MVWQGHVLAGKAKQDEAANAIFVTPSGADTLWVGANKNQIAFNTPQGNIIWYGHQLIANTAYYYGPKGVVSHTANGMNCQNCHLDAGTLPLANNFGKVYATYPQYRSRNNSVQSIYGRITDCFERSLNGVAPDTNSYEMRAMYAYIKWLGDDVPKGSSPAGTSIPRLPYLNRAANPVEGQKVFMTTCSSCHGKDGQGKLNTAGTGYMYPPLWGPDSYNDGAGLYRISSFAGYVKNNMPFGTTYKAPLLTNEQAWDVAAFINSKPRPHKDQTSDWPIPKLKPVDFPYGPYTDNFTEQQHKYGPFKPIIDAGKK